jgi:hypothetical protein
VAAGEEAAQPSDENSQLPHRARFQTPLALAGYILSPRRAKAFDKIAVDLEVLAIARGEAKPGEALHIP